MAGIDEDEESPLLLGDSAATQNAVASGREACGDFYHTLEEGISRRKTPRASDNGSVEYNRLNCNPKDELRKFEMVLFLVGLHQSSLVSLFASWTLFFVVSILVPVLEGLSVACSSRNSHWICDVDIVVQLSESSLAVISFLFLSRTVGKHGLRRLLFLDQIERESRTIQLGFKKELNAALWLVAWILLPCFVAKLIHEIWWFTQVSVKIPFIQDKLPYSIILFTAVLLSWLYRTSLFLFVCIVFRLTCSVQFLSFEGYTKLLEETPEVLLILKEHMRIRRQLFIISHRFRVFILSSLVSITVSQFVSLFMTTAAARDIDFLKAGNLVVCSAVQLTGFVLCLHGAARITHRAQRIVSIVSQWHVLSTCRSLTMSESESENLTTELHAINADGICFSSNEYTSDADSVADVCAIVPSQYELASYQKRQALVSYMQHSNAGISLYGFVLDRGFIYALFVLELSLVLFILGLTIGIN